MVDLYKNISKRWNIKHGTHAYLRDWDIDPAEVRAKKIDKVLN
jgi:hypothetical protein